MSYLFTSESVSEGHPDKVADQISDAILDAILAKDKTARVACETLVTTGMAMIAGYLVQAPVENVMFQVVLWWYLVIPVAAAAIVTPSTSSLRMRSKAAA